MLCMYCMYRHIDVQYMHFVKESNEYTYVCNTNKIIIIVLVRSCKNVYSFHKREQQKLRLFAYLIAWLL